MFRVFNMGVGFCVVVAANDAASVAEIAKAHGKAAAPVGYAVADKEKRVWVTQRGLTGQGSTFAPNAEPAPANPAA
jgi:phosphoribosylaminoimidazole (AIR) synthetase